MGEQDYKLPLGLCKQAVMKLDAFITDVREIVEDPDLEQEDRQDFETMAEMAGTMLATIVNIVNKECEEAVFLGEKIPMDDIDEYPEDPSDDADIMDTPIEEIE